MPFRVLNKHKMPDDIDGVYLLNVMRPTVLGNPFPITDQHPRAMVIKMYRRYLFEKLRDRQSAEAIEIERLAGLHQQGVTIGLVCVCVPQDCHAHVIVAACEWVTAGRPATPPSRARLLSAEEFAVMLNDETLLALSATHVGQIAKRLGLVYVDEYSGGRGRRLYHLSDKEVLLREWRHAGRSGGTLDLFEAA